MPANRGNIKAEKKPTQLPFQTHLNAKVAEVLFLQGDKIKSAFAHQEAMEADRR